MLLEEGDGAVHVVALEVLGHRLEVAVREEDRPEPIELCQMGLQRAAASRPNRTGTFASGSRSPS